MTSLSQVVSGYGFWEGMVLTARNNQSRLWLLALQGVVIGFLLIRVETSQEGSPE